MIVHADDRVHQDGVAPGDAADAGAESAVLDAADAGAEPAVLIAGGGGVRVGPTLLAVPGASAAQLRSARWRPEPVPVAVLQVFGEIDQVSVGPLAAALGVELARAGSATGRGAASPGSSDDGAEGWGRPVGTRLVVDVSGMSFCATAGLDVLSRTARAAEGAGLSWALAGLGPRLSGLLTELWPAPHPRCYPDRASAAAALSLDPEPAPPPACSCHGPASPGGAESAGGTDDPDGAGTDTGVVSAAGPSS